MSKLLSAEFSRLLKNKTFIYLNVISFCFLSLIMIFIFVDYKLNPPVEAIHLDMFLRIYFAAVGFWVSILISFFFGNELSERTINNKLTVGYSFTQIYVAELIICTLGAILMQLFYLLVFFGFHIPMFGISALSANEILICEVKGLFVSASYSSLMLLITVVGGNKSSAVVGSSALVVLMIVAYGVLQVPDVSQACPDIIEKLVNLSPVAMTFSIDEMELKDYLISYGFITVISSALGIWIFRNRDLK